MKLPSLYFAISASSICYLNDTCYDAFYKIFLLFKKIQFTKYEEKEEVVCMETKILKAQSESFKSMLNVLERPIALTSTRI